ncbi:MAG TPA: cytochrome-c peroxidase [Devosia sp.]|nr:cytochrome-c peroxidase [Devosia sp.]
MKLPLAVAGFVAIAGALALSGETPEHQTVLPLPSADAQFRVAPMASVELGRQLFYDPVLSGNKAVACATCHFPDFGTSDGVSLSIGDGGIGLGPDRKIDPDNIPEQRVGRNAPSLFNLGAGEFNVMFHDGRLEEDETRPSGIRSPLEDNMVSGFSSILAAQAMFPVLSPDEMAGHYSENEISTAVRQGRLTGERGAWELIADRVSAIPAYKEGFRALRGDDREISFIDISNVIADFIAFEWRTDNSPFDAYLRGESILSELQLAGMGIFYGKGECASCHSGQFQTDQQFYAIAMPQIGPGKAARFETHNKDVGRMRVTGDADDAYRFRTPSLRNTALSAPYGHSGAYATLEAVVRHHLNPVEALYSYDRTQAILPDFPGASDWNVLDDPAEMAAIAAANELEPVDLNETELVALLAFLNALTDPRAVTGRLGVPDSVPSGLPVAGGR